MTAYRELIERLERTTKPDAELDGDIVEALFPDDTEYAFETGSLPDGARYNFTESNDAAIALVEKMLPGRFWGCDKWNGFYTAHITSPTTSRAEARAATAPIAICLAALRALEAQSKDKEEGE